MIGQRGVLSQADILAAEIRPSIKILLAAKNAGLSKRWQWYLMRKIIRPKISRAKSLAAWRLVYRNPHWSLKVDKAPPLVSPEVLAQLEG